MKPSKPHLTYQTSPYSSILLLSSPQSQPFVWLPWQLSLTWSCKEQRIIPCFYSSVSVLCHAIKRTFKFYKTMYY